MPQILKEWKRFFKAHKLCTIAPWPSNAGLPRAQWIQKFKNEKYRPIIACSAHPLRSHLNLAGRALMFLLRKLLEHTGDHYVLWSTRQLEGRIREWQRSAGCCSVHGSKMQWLLMFGDIANFYSEIDQQRLLKAHAWVRHGATQLRGSRSGRVCIKRRGAAGVRWGRAYDDRSTVEIHIDTVFDLLSWDATNCTFTWGAEVTLLQTWGIAMGTPPAPPNAIASAAYDEACLQWTCKADSKWISSSGQHILSRLQSVRYMDDTCTGCTYCAQCEGDKQLAEELLSHYQLHCYPPPLQLEIDSSNKYLQCEVWSTGECVFTSWQNKNIQEKEQKILRLQRWDSYSSNRSKTRVLADYLHTIDGCCSDRLLTMACLPHFIREVHRELFYPAEAIAKAIQTAYSAPHHLELQAVALALVDIL
jgi:hypothetical protein